MNTFTIGILLGIMIGGLFVTFTDPKSEQNKKPSN